MHNEALRMRGRYLCAIMFSFASELTKERHLRITFCCRPENRETISVIFPSLKSLANCNAQELLEGSDSGRGKSFYSLLILYYFSDLLLPLTH